MEHKITIIEDVTYGGFVGFVENIPGAIIVGWSREEIIRKSDRVIKRMEKFRMPL